MTRQAPGVTGPAASPVRSQWRAARGPALVLVGVVFVGLVAALLVAGQRSGLLDPTATTPDGARALAVLLGNRGTTMTVVRDLGEAAREAGPDTTVFVPMSARLAGEDVSLLGASGATVVVASPAPQQLTQLIPGARERSAPVRSRPVDCDLPAAVTAGSAELGGTTYDVADPAVMRCYPSGTGAGLVQRGDTTVVGSPSLFTNARLAHDGNAALALGLLGQRPRLLWLLPRVAVPAATQAQRPLHSLLPARLLLALAEVAVAVVLLALWRARRLGPVVPEPLPVIVRAAETALGRGRLYRAAAARAEAAEALRAGCRARVAARLGLPAEPAPAALVDALASRAGRSAADVAALLYGAPATDERGLVALADALDALDQEVRRG